MTLTCQEVIYDTVVRKRTQNSVILKRTNDVVDLERTKKILKVYKKSYFDFFYSLKVLICVPFFCK